MSRQATKIRNYPHLFTFAVALGGAVAACDAPDVDAERAGETPLGDEIAAEETILSRYQERLLAAPETEMRGVVTTTDGAPVPGVRVAIDGQEAVTDAAGEYVVPGVEVGSHVISFAHPDHVFVQRRLTLEQPEPGWLPQVLLPRGKPQRLQADRLTVVREGPLTLEFEPGDLEFERDHAEVHGDVEIQVTVIDPRVRGHLDAAPAELEGVTVDGDQIGLFSYGMLEVEMVQGGRKVQVRRGETVKATMDVTAGYSLAAGAAIPMWHHDTMSGIWVQERGVDARVRDQDGARLATAELPHFSAWNYDSPGHGVCAPLVVPSTMNVSRVRVTSTNSVGTPDNLWSISFDCATASGRSSRCAVNVPAGAGFTGDNGNVYFKIQSQTQGSSTWCDMNVALNGSTKTVWTRADVNAYLSANSLSSGTWCGSQKPTGGWVSSNFNFSTGDYQLPTNRVSFGIPQSSSNCVSTVGANAVAASDQGFKSMAANAASLAYKNDYDADGIADKTDKCVGNKTSNQGDGDNDGYGDMCEKMCYVPPSLPDADWYDQDGDGIDDYCDKAWSVYNPSQY
jgi:hypothetical protein